MAPPCLINWVLFFMQMKIKRYQAFLDTVILLFVLTCLILTSTWAMPSKIFSYLFPRGGWGQLSRIFFHDKFKTRFIVAYWLLKCFFSFYCPVFWLGNHEAQWSRFHCDCYIGIETKCFSNMVLVLWCCPMVWNWFYKEILPRNTSCVIHIPLYPKNALVTNNLNLSRTYCNGIWKRTEG